MACIDDDVGTDVLRSKQKNSFRVYAIFTNVVSGISGLIFLVLVYTAHGSMLKALQKIQALA